MRICFMRTQFYLTLYTVKQYAALRRMCVNSFVKCKSTMMTNSYVIKVNELLHIIMGVIRIAHLHQTIGIEHVRTSLYYYISVTLTNCHRYWSLHLNAMALLFNIYKQSTEYLSACVHNSQITVSLSTVQYFAIQMLRIHSVSNVNLIN